LRLSAYVMGLGVLMGTTWGLAGCSSENPAVAQTNDAGAQTDGQVGDANAEADAAPPPAITLASACSDTLDSVYGDPGSLPAIDPTIRGDIVKCSTGADISAADLLAQAKTDGYVGRDFTSGAHVYRVLYRTERGTNPPTPGVSSAIVYVPDHPRSADLPAIVVSHGTRGEAPNCASSKTVPADFELRLQAYPLVGSGYVVIAPDLAGYADYGAPGNPPSGYAGAVDVGMSTLDGARALNKLLSNGLSDKVVLVGHSQGGQTTLAALALADSYGAGGTIAGVVTYSPLWLAQRTWGALFLLASQYTIKKSSLVNAVDVWYHYTNGELMDPGHGLDPFVPSKRAAIKDFVDHACLADSYPRLEALGTTVKDLYTQEFQSSIMLPAALGQPCKDLLCAKWMHRYAADRPHLTGTATKVPILLNYGGQDTTIPPDRMACVFDRLGSDGANYTVCYQKDADHDGIVMKKADYTNDWIAHIALGAPAPAPCAENQSNITNSDGTPVACATPPPND